MEYAESLGLVITCSCESLLAVWDDEKRIWTQPDCEGDPLDVDIMGEKTCRVTCDVCGKSQTLPSSIEVSAFEKEHGL